MSNVWYEDPKSGDIYHDTINSRGRTIRAYRSYPKESSRAESSSTPRTQRDSVYDRPADEPTNRRQRVKSTLREPTRGDTRASYTESDCRQPYPEDDRRDADEPVEAYFDSSRQASTSYQPRDKFEPSPPSRQFTSAQPRHLSPRPFDPRTADALVDGFSALHVGEGNYTNSPSATRDWQPPTAFNLYEEAAILSSDRDSAQQSYSGQGYYENQPPSVAQMQQSPNRVAQGTAGSSEKLDSSYKARSKDWKVFFKIGRVFSTSWTDSLGNNASEVDPTFVSEVYYDERVYAKIRQFIVVLEGDGAVSCLPVTSYNDVGIRKNGIRLDEHGFIYSKKKPKRVEDTCSRPLKLNVAQGAAHLKDPSLVNYGKIYNVETNVKVKNIGTLDSDSKEILLRYFRRVFSGIEDPGQAGLTPRASEVVLFGVGAALNAYLSSVPPASNMPATTTSSGFTSISTAPGYPPSSTIYGASHDSGARGGSSGYYPPNPQYETASTVSYIPTSSTYVMDSTLHSRPSCYATKLDVDSERKDPYQDHELPRSRFRGAIHSSPKEPEIYSDQERFGSSPKTDTIDPALPKPNVDFPSTSTNPLEPSVESNPSSQPAGPTAMPIPENSTSYSKYDQSLSSDPATTTTPYYTIGTATIASFALGVAATTAYVASSLPP